MFVMAVTKQFQSIIYKYISRELHDELFKLTMMHDATNNAKGFELKRLLTKYNVPFQSLGPGTNRFGIMIEGYAVKFALDSDGMIDNRREFLYTQQLYPYVAKCYECFKNGLVAVTEYLDPFTIDDFYKNSNKMREILEDISNKGYLIGDVGITSKNYLNWGIRHTPTGDEPAILDFAYIYDVKYGLFRCTCDNTSLLGYDKEFVNFICPRCGKKFTFADMRRRISAKNQEEEIGDITRLGYVLHNKVETLPVNKEFTVEKTKKKKEPSEIEKLIKAHRRERKALKLLYSDI